MTPCGPSWRCAAVRAARGPGVRRHTHISPCGGRCGDRTACAHARRLRRPDATRGRRVLHHGARALVFDVTTSRLHARGASRGEERWHELAAGAAVRAVVPSARPGRLAFEQIGLSSVLAPSACRSTTGPTTPCRPGHRSPAPSRSTTAPSSLTIPSGTSARRQPPLPPRHPAGGARRRRCSSARARSPPTGSGTVAKCGRPSSSWCTRVDHRRFSPSEPAEGERTGALLDVAGVPADAPLVVFVGTLEPRQGWLRRSPPSTRWPGPTRTPCWCSEVRPAGDGRDRACAGAGPTRGPDRPHRGTCRTRPFRAAPAGIGRGRPGPSRRGFDFARPGGAGRRRAVGHDGGATAMAELARGRGAPACPRVTLARWLARLRTALDGGPCHGTDGLGNRRCGERTWGQAKRGAARFAPMRWPGRPRIGFRGCACDHRGEGLRGPVAARRGILSDRGDDVAVIDIETDVADAAAVRRVMADVMPDAVYHLAAMTHVGESWENPSQVLRVNVVGTAEILAAGRALPVSPGPRRASAEVYGVVAPEQLRSRRTRHGPASPYAASKLAVEAVALQAWRGTAARHRGAALQPHRTRPVAHFLRAALAKRIVEARRSGATSSAGRHPDHPAGFHRCARRRDGLPASDRDGCPR